MRSLRVSGVPSVLLALLMAFGVLVPEAGHSLAHSQGFRHADEGRGDHAPGGGAAAGAFVSHGHAPGDHPHFELDATLPGKPLIPCALAGQALERLFLDSGLEHRRPAAGPAMAAPLQSNHGPPPPTRAPPSV